MCYECMVDGRGFSSLTKGLEHRLALKESMLNRNVLRTLHKLTRKRTRVRFLYFFSLKARVAASVADFGNDISIYRW